MLKRFNLSLIVAVFLIPVNTLAEQDAQELVRAAWDQVRGLSSYAEMTMTIHRPSWERAMSMRAWTLGQKHSLVRVTAPKKDAGNGTLMKDNSMWSFAPWAPRASAASRPRISS